METVTKHDPEERCEQLPDSLKSATSKNTACLCGACLQAPYQLEQPACIAAKALQLAARLEATLMECVDSQRGSKGLKGWPKPEPREPSEACTAFTVGSSCRFQPLAWAGGWRSEAFFEDHLRSQENRKTPCPLDIYNENESAL